MACCYIAAFCISQLVKVYQFLDVDDAIRYNEDEPELPYPTSKSPNGEDIKCEKRNASLVLSLSGLTCSACSSAVESALRSHPDVDQVRVSLALQQATLIGKTASFDTQSITRLVTDLGYGAELGPRSPREVIRVLKSKEEIARLKSSLSSLAGCATVNQTIAFLISVGQDRIPSAILFIAHLLCAVLTLFAQWQYISWIHKDGWKAICRWQPNMNTLVSSSISLGTSISFIDLLTHGTTGANSYYTTVIGLALVVVAGRYIELMSRRTTSEDLLRVYKPLTQSNYTRLHPTGKVVPQSYPAAGDQIIIPPYSIIPCDCYVAEGTSSINQALITGEALPVRKSVGDFLLGGTRNLGKELVAVVDKEQGNSFYSQLVHGAVEAAGSKDQDNRTVDMVTKYLVGFVMSLALVVPLKDIYISAELLSYEVIRVAMARAMTILTCACPCALGLAIPSAVVAAVGIASQNGLLITRGYNTIQKLSSTQSIVFDKTGTLTRAVLDITDFETTEAWKKPITEFWTYICAAEEGSVTSHPIGRAIFTAGVNHLNGPWSETKSLIESRNIASESGKGVSGEVSLGQEPWRRVDIGSTRYLLSCGVSDLPGVSEGQDSGLIAVYVAIDRTYAGTLYVTDAVRDDAEKTIQRLYERGYATHLLTGDMPQSANRISQQLKIPVLASEATPQDKLDLVKRLQKDGKAIAMVGDGLNDSLSLAAADVGIALYHDVATPTVGATVFILNSRLDSIPLLLEIAELTIKQIRYNLAWVFGYNALALSMASGLFSPFGIVLTP
ncbi:P-type ATPase [Fusarium tjaetaba]|uniref:P-type ATPase n=1 Tax=Fusarium tjaetaba TaxID=1567544 RepID=A0A8H5W5A3_9HYPO|nr:P-type ATPase [Fusarium tjaetaba]KAF5645828.1 P-type ATPase [Fusarium tjaetaba]